MTTKLRSLGNKLHPVGPLNVVNYALNPAMSVGDATLTNNLRTNLCTNPSFATNLSGWNSGTAWTTTQTTGQYVFNPGAMKAVRNTATAGNGNASFAWTAVSGQTYTASVYVYGGSGNYSIHNATGSVQTTTFAAPGNSWTRVSVTFTAGGTAETFYISDDPNGAPTNGTVLWIDNILIEQTANLNDYFDGAFDAYVSRTNLCTNPSLETNTTGWAATTATLTSTSAMRLFGVKCGLINWTGGSAGNVAYSVATTIGQLYSASIYVYIPSGNPPVQLTVAGQGVAQSSTITNDWQRLSIVFTATSASHQIEILESSSAAGQCYFDALLIEAGVTGGDYFDGSKPTMLGTTQQWTGAPYASTSIQRIPNGTTAWTGTANASTSTRYDIGPKWWVASNAVLTRDSIVSFNGLYSAKMKPTLTSAIPKMQQTFTVQDSTNYSVSFFVYIPATNTGGGVSVEFDCYDITNTLIVQNTTPLLVSGNATNGFIRLATTFQMPAGTNTVTVSIRPPSQPSSLNDIIYVDSFLFEQADTSSPNYVDGDCAGYFWSGVSGESTTLRTNLPYTLQFFATSAYYPPTAVPAGNVAMSGSAQVLPTSWPTVPLTD